MICSYFEGDLEEFIAEKVIELWCKTNNQEPVIAIFKQKYAFETEWESVRILITNESENDEFLVTFDWDFNEGETCLKDLYLIELDTLIDVYLDVTQRAHAQWIEDGYTGDPYVCSNCGEPAIMKIKTRFCPYCGVKMKEDPDNGT